VSAVLAVGWGGGVSDRPGSEALGGAVALAAQFGVPALYASLGDPPEPGAQAAAELWRSRAALAMWSR
jgi:hypothetical protein